MPVVSHWAGALVSEVGQVGAGSGQVVGATRQGGREPQQLTVGIGDDLHVHVVTHSTSMRQVECGRMDDQRGPRAR